MNRPLCTSCSTKESTRYPQHQTTLVSAKCSTIRSREGVDPATSGQALEDWAAALLLGSFLTRPMFLVTESVTPSHRDDEAEIAALPGYSVADHVHRHNNAGHL